MINCSEFLARYSEFRDDFLDADLHRSFALHLELCESCARYDRVVAGGIDTLLRLPEITLSDDFTDRLDLRIAADNAYLEARAVSGTPVALVVAVAATIGAAAWLPALREDVNAMLLPPAVAHAPYHPQVLPLVFHPGVLPASGVTYPRPAAYGASSEFSPYSLLGTPTRPAQVAQAGR